ncbi:MAG: hypothetical protein ACPHJX_01855 [Candidatus Thalassarchaeaceae archaeon]
MSPQGSITTVSIILAWMASGRYEAPHRPSIGASGWGRITGCAGCDGD